jgi:hypothetical protein
MSPISYFHFPLFPYFTRYYKGNMYHVPYFMVPS